MKLLHQLGTILGPLAAVLAASSDGPTWIRGAGAALGALVSLLAVLEKGWGKQAPPAALLLLLLLPLAACPKPTPGPVPPGHGVVECGEAAVAKCAPSALPAVNECLSGKGDVTSCLLGLIQPAGCITYAVVACLVQHEGGAAERASSRNPDDAVDARRAARAREFLDGQHVQFAP